MKLVTKVANKIFEESPGYYTVYGDDDRSIGVLVATKTDDVYWLYGDAECAELQGEVKELCEQYGMPYTVPARLEVVPLEVYETDAAKLARVQKSQQMLDALVAEIDSELGAKKR